MTFPSKNYPFDRKRPWMQTFTGKAVDMLHPTRDMIDVKDLAHHLALECRFAGACKFHYSIAQHSYLAAQGAQNERATQKQQLEILLHDAHEAYTKDIHAPYRWAAQELMGVEDDMYGRIADEFDVLIRSMWDLPSMKTHVCHAFDMRMLFTERAQIMSPPPGDWVGEDEWIPLDIKIVQWTPTMAEKTWLGEVKRLTKLTRST